MSDKRLLSPEERKLRDLLWAAHTCSGKYGDDGEIQCGCFFPVIDFLRDTPEEIKAKTPIHYAEAALAKVDKQDRPELREKIKEKIDGILVAYETMLACQIPKKFADTREQIKQVGSAQILAIVNEEEMKLQGYMLGTLDTLKGEEEIRKQERERIRQMVMRKLRYGGKPDPYNVALREIEQDLTEGEGK